MTRSDMVLASVVSIVWGLAFVATKYALEGFSAPQLTAIRFALACLPVMFLPRPPVPWSVLLLTGMTLFAGQFLLLFFAYLQGLPPGLASITQQTQAFFTVMLASIFLRDIPTRLQVLGMAIGLLGLALIALTVGGDVTYAGLGLALGAALSWAVGNVLVKRMGSVPMFPLVAWLSLVPPIPALLISGLADTGPSLLGAVAAAPWQAIAAGLYLGIVATAFAYAIWGGLLARCPTGALAPFALIAPCAGVLASAALFAEQFGPMRYAGMALVLAGLAVSILPTARPNASKSEAPKQTSRSRIGP